MLRHVLVYEVGVLLLVDVYRVLIGHPVRRKYHDGCRLHLLRDFSPNLLKDGIHRVGGVILNAWLCAASAGCPKTLPSATVAHPSMTEEVDGHLG